MKARKERVRDIYDEIVSQHGCWPCVSNLARYLSIDDRKVKEWMSGLPAIRDGRRMRFHAKAVAERLADMEARSVMEWRA